jgi:hypothetical protein
MRSHLLLFFFCFAVFAASLFGTLFWLSIPLLLQVIVDKAIAPGSSETLKIIGLSLLIVTLIASASEIGLNIFTQQLVRSKLIDREIFLQLAAFLPKVLAVGILLAIYSQQIAIIATVLAAIACGATIFVRKFGSTRSPDAQPLPLSFRLPLTLVVLFVLWYGAFQVQAGELLLGQWLSVGVLSIQFVASLLSFTVTALSDG